MNESQINTEGIITSKYEKQIKIISLLLFLIFFMMLLSLVSFSPHDEQNAQISFVDVIKLFSGDSDLEAKASVTKNWLGLTGAKISDFIYNKTIGYYFITLPIVLLYWTWLLFAAKKVTKNIAKYTIIYFLLGLFFAGFIGSLQKIDFLSTIPKEWSGSVGQYIAFLMSNIIGSIGAVILFALGIVLVIYLGTELKLVFDNKYKLLILKLFKSHNKDNVKSEDTPVPIVATPQDIQFPIHTHKIDDKATSIVEPVKFENSTVSQILKSPKINIKKVNNEPISVSSLNNPFEIINKNDNDFDSLITEINENEIPQKMKVQENKDDSPISNQESLLENPQETLIGNSGKLNLKVALSADNSENNFLDLPASHTKSAPLTSASYLSKTDEKKLEEKEIPDSEELQSTKLNISIKNTPIYRNSALVPQLHTHIHDEKISYKVPPVSLLNNESSQTNVNEEELQTNARILQEKLETFKIFIEDLTVTPGPVVTQYEFVPAPGIKISKIESLADDLAMALKAKGIRIIAPIPGKGTIGVEIPNNNPSIVRFGEIVSSPKFANANAKLPLVLGKTISGEVFISDLTKMPHLLIAGSTGSGKSVGINSVITSLLYKKHPSELKFVIIDPKKVELQQYAGLSNHFIATSPDIEDLIVTKPEDAVAVLKSAVREMELRYDILASVGQRNIADYNEKVRNGTIKNNENNIYKQLPYIVVIIDELADLMLTASKEIEEPITRLAQMARAIGIHLVIATQRPSVDVITGIIKANFPARIAYLVASKIDSRTILDMQGAEQLLGMGDMLFLPSGQPKPVRIQNAFISTEEVENVCEFIENQKGYSEPYYLPSLVDKTVKGMIDPSDRDPLFEEAAKLIIRTQQGSVSLIQRRLKVGYARAGRIVDELESAGVVGPFDGSKARQVLMESESELEAIL